MGTILESMPTKNCVGPGKIEFSHSVGLGYPAYPTRRNLGLANYGNSVMQLTSLSITSTSRYLALVNHYDITSIPLTFLHKYPVAVHLIVGLVPITTVCPHSSTGIHFVIRYPGITYSSGQETETHVTILRTILLIFYTSKAQPLLAFRVTRDNRPPFEPENPEMYINLMS